MRRSRLSWPGAARTAESERDRTGRLRPHRHAEGEKGADKVAAAIADARICTINYAEVVTHFIHLGMPEREVDAMLDPLPMTIVPTDKALAQMAGRLRAVTANHGLSLGDRFCLALAQRDGLPAWTSDQGWKAVADAVKTKVVAIR